MKRRWVLGALATGFGLPLCALAQHPGRLPVVGLLITHPPVTDPVVDSLRKGLRQYGYEDERNIKIEVRTALGRLERVPALAEELVRHKVDVIVVGNEPALRAARQATSTIPIVMVGFNDDPVAMGWINSYRQPGGNVTGIYNINSALASKRLEIVRETLPGVSLVAVLWDAFGRRQLDEIQRAAQPLRLQLHLIELAGVQDLDAAFKAAKRRKAGAVLLVWSPVFYVNQARVAALGIATGLPVFTDLDTLAQAGALLSYGSDRDANLARAAYYVDRVLKGSKAADLPVEELTKVKLVVNLKTAQAIKLIIPQSIILRADEVIRQ